MKGVKLFPKDVKRYILCCLPVKVFASLKLPDRAWRWKIQHDYPWSFQWMQCVNSSNQSWWEFMDLNFCGFTPPNIESGHCGTLGALCTTIHMISTHESAVIILPPIPAATQWVFLRHDQPGQFLFGQCTRTTGVSDMHIFFAPDFQMDMWGGCLCMIRRRHEWQLGREYVVFDSPEDWRDFLRPYGLTNLIKG